MGIEQDLDKLREKVLETMKAKGPRECARLLDRDAGYISRVINGKQALGMRATLRLADALKIKV